jgi:hypothetical protein
MYLQLIGVVIEPLTVKVVEPAAQAVLSFQKETGINNCASVTRKVNKKSKKLKNEIIFVIQGLQLSFYLVIVVLNSKLAFFTYCSGFLSHYIIFYYKP